MSILINDLQNVEEVEEEAALLVVALVDAEDNKT